MISGVAQVFELCFSARQAKRVDSTIQDDFESSKRSKSSSSVIGGISSGLSSSANVARGWGFNK